MNKWFLRLGSTLLAASMILSLVLVAPVSAAGGAMSATFGQATGVMNGAYVNANGTGEVERPTSIAGNEAIDGKYFINGVLKDSKLITSNLTGTCTSGTTKVEVSIQNISTNQYLKIEDSAGAFVAEETLNAATISGSNGTTWTIPGATLRTIDWPNGNYIAKAYAYDDTRGVPSTISFTVFNAQVISPAFDAIATGQYTVEVGMIDLGAAVTDMRADVVRAYDGMIVGGAQLVKGEGEETYKGVLDTQAIESDVYTLVVTALGENYEGRVFSDFVIANESLTPTQPVEVSPEGREFLLDGEPFRYTGGNNYGFSMKPTETKTSDNFAVIWLGDEPVITLVPTGTRWRFEEKTDRTFMELKKTNNRVLRIWFFSQGTENPATAIRRDGLGGDSNYRVRYFYDTDGDGKQEIIYNDVTLSRMDYILYSADKHGVMIMPTLANYWNDYGGIQTNMNYIKNAYPEDAAAQAQAINTSTYADVAAAPQNAFFVSEGAWESYKSLIDTYAGRISTVDGKAWKGNPAIFAWDLMNEPRFGLDQDNSRDGLFWEGDGQDAKNYFFTPEGEWKGNMPANLGAADPRLESYKNPAKFAIAQTDRTLYKWIDRASSYLKSIDPTHMVVAGTEGQTQANPTALGGQPWAGWTSQGYGGDPLGTTAAPNIDMVSYHPYITQNWAQTGVQNDNVFVRPNGGFYTPAEAEGIIKSLNDRAKELGMPMIDGELGMGKGGAMRMSNGSGAPSGSTAMASNYNWYWNIQLAGAISGEQAGLNSWQTTLQGHNDGLGYIMYHNNNASSIITGRRYWEYFIRAGKLITQWQAPVTSSSAAYSALSAAPGAALDSLSVTADGRQLIESFDPAVREYVVTAPYLATAVTMNAAGDADRVEYVTYSGTGVTGNLIGLAPWGNATVVDIKLFKDGVVSTYRVKIVLDDPSTEKSLNSFSLTVDGAFFEGVIDQEAQTIQVNVPYGADLSSVSPEFSFDGLAVIVGNQIQTSGTTARNLTAPTTYLVMAEDGSDVLYTLTVSSETFDVSVSTPTIVETLPANLNITSSVDGTAYLKVDGQLLYATPVVNGGGRMRVSEAPAAGTYSLVVLSGQVGGECEINVVPYDTSIWTATAFVPESGKINLRFNTDVTSKNGFGVKINGAAVSSAQKDARTLELNALGAEVANGSKIVVSNIKMPELFPSYVFSFTVTFTTDEG